MDISDYVFIMVAYIIAGIIKGITGVGFSTSCLPILALRLDLKIAIPLVIFPSIVSNVVLMAQAGQFFTVFKRFWLLYAASIPGLWIGLTILLSINVDVAKTILGLVLILYAFLALQKKGIKIAGRWEQNLKFPVGFLTGFINGLTGSQVMPILPYLLSIDLRKNTFIQAINISFTLSSLVMLIGMNQAGHLSARTIYLALCGVVPVVMIVFICAKARSNVSEMLYRKLVLIFLLLLGVFLSTKSILSI